MASMAFDVFARDHASRTFDQVGDSAQRLERRLDGVGKSGDGLRGNMNGLSGVVSGLGGHLSGLGGTLASTSVAMATTALKVSTMAASAASAASTLGGLVAALAPAAGALAALPAALSLGAAAMATLKFATAGLGDAFGAALTGDVEKFLEAVGPLPEKVADFAWQLRALKPDIDSLRITVQNSFFGPLLADLQTTGELLVSVVKPGMNAVAGEFGRLGAAILEAGQSVSVMRLLEGSFATLRRILSDIRSDTLRGLLADMAAFAAATLPAFDGLGSTIDRLAQRFSTFLRDAAFSGTALEWVQGAIDVFKQLGAILADLGGIVSAVFSAMKRVTGDTLGVLGQLLDSLHAFLDSAQGQDTLITVFRALDEVGRALTPVIGAIGQAVAAIAPEVAKVATALGPVLADAIRALGAGIAAMGPGLVKLVEGLGRAVQAIGPLLEPLGKELGNVFAELGGALALIVPELGKIAVSLAPALANAFHALGPALAALGPGLTMVAEYLAKAFADPALQVGLLAIGKGIADVLIAAAPLLPVIAQLAGILGQVLGGALTNLGTALGPIITALVSALEPALRAITDALNLLVPLMPPIYKAFGDIGAALITQLLPPVLDLIPALVDALIPAMAEFARQLQPLIPLLADLAIKLLQQVLPAILPILPQLTELSLALARMGIVLAQLVADTAPYIERIIQLFQHLYDRLVGHSIIPDLINGIGSWIGRLPGMFTEWVGRAKDAAIGKFNELVTAASQIPGRIVSALGDLGNLLFSSGQSIIQGLINGLYSMLQNAYNAASDILGQIRNLFPFSPAKEGPFSGRGWTLFSGISMGEALAAGLAKSEGLVAKAADGLMGAASVSLTPSVAAGGQAPLPLTPQGGLTINLHFSGSPLVSRDEIYRMLISALNEARARGFNLGNLGGVSG